MMEKTIHNSIRIETDHGTQKAIYPGDVLPVPSSDPGDRGSDVRFGHKLGLVPFQIAIAGRSYNGNHSMSLGMCDLSDSFVLRDTREVVYGAAGGTSARREDLSSAVGNIVRETIREYEQEEYRLRVTVVHQYAADAAVIRSYTEVRNLGDEAVTLLHLSSAYVPGIAPEGFVKWYDPSRHRLHTCYNGWHAEGQWREESLEDRGLYPASSYGINNAVLLHSVGTFSTGKYMPLGILEDRETGSVYYWQIENSSSWYWAIGFRGFADDPAGSLFLECGNCDERYLGWTKTLAPGGEFRTPVTAFGTVRGDFTDAVAELTKYRRHCLYPEKAWVGELPVCFNDFMNCLWGQPTSDRLYPLIDAAAAAGAETFCIDAGWFGDAQPPFQYAYEYGDWNDSRDRFGEKGLQGVLDHIRDKGMKPGIWLEIEVCGNRSALQAKDDAWFLMRNGKRVGGGARYFLDFCNEEVFCHAMNVIDGLYRRGIRFIKNDYNDDIGVGCSYAESGSYGDGMLRFVSGFYRFIDEVRRRYPDLTLENCASGAMRQDYGILSRFHLQSSSDQVVYDRYPSIVNGSLACVLPEQLGVWSYPYPIAINDYDKPETLQTPEYQARMADGEETVFNMVTGFCGTLYLSGHIDYADSFNAELIREAVSCYKEERAFIRTSYPFWPTGMKRINDRHCFLTQGLHSPDRTRALIAVWRRQADDDTVQLDLSRLADGEITVRAIYPKPGSGFDVPYYTVGKKLVVLLARTNTARLLEVTVAAREKECTDYSKQST
jgi:alpha-galactosidase